MTQSTFLQGLRISNKHENCTAHKELKNKAEGWARQTDSQEKVPAAKPEDPSSIPKTPVVGGEKQLLKGVFWSYLHTVVPLPHNKQTNKHVISKIRKE